MCCSIFPICLSCPHAELAGVEQVGHVVALKLWGSEIARMVSMLIALTLLCQVSAMLMVGPRIVEAMARDGFLPPASEPPEQQTRAVPSRRTPGSAGRGARLDALVRRPARLHRIHAEYFFGTDGDQPLPIAPRRTRAHQDLCRLSGDAHRSTWLFTLWMTVWSIREQPVATGAGLATLAAGYGLYLIRAKQARIDGTIPLTDS